MVLWASKTGRYVAVVGKRAGGHERAAFWATNAVSTVTLFPKCLLANEPLAKTARAQTRNTIVVVPGV